MKQRWNEREKPKERASKQMRWRNREEQRPRIPRARQRNERTNECKKGNGEQGKWWNGKKKRGTDDERKEKERGKKKHTMKEKRHSRQRWLQILGSCWYRDVRWSEASRFRPKLTDLPRFPQCEKVTE